MLVSIWFQPERLHLILKAGKLSLFDFIGEKSEIDVEIHAWLSNEKIRRAMILCKFKINISNLHDESERCIELISWKFPITCVLVLHNFSISNESLPWFISIYFKPHVMKFSTNIFHFGDSHINSSRHFQMAK